MIGSSAVPADPAAQKTLPQISRAATATPKADPFLLTRRLLAARRQRFLDGHRGFDAQQSIRRFPE